MTAAAVALDGLEKEMECKRRSCFLLFPIQGTGKGIRQDKVASNIEYLASSSYAPLGRLVRDSLPIYSPGCDGVAVASFRLDRGTWIYR